MKDVNNNLLENSEETIKRKRDESSYDEGSVKKQKLISGQEESSDSQSNYYQDNYYQDNDYQGNINISDTQADNAGQSNSLDQQDNDHSESSSDDETDSETKEGFDEIESLHGSLTRDYMSNLINSFKQARRNGDKDRLNTARFDLRNYRNH